MHKNKQELEKRKQELLDTENSNLDKKLSNSLSQLLVITGALALAIIMSITNNYYLVLSVLLGYVSFSEFLIIMDNIMLKDDKDVKIKQEIKDIDKELKKLDKEKEVVKKQIKEEIQEVVKEEKVVIENKTVEKTPENTVNEIDFDFMSILEAFSDDGPTLKRKK